MSKHTPASERPPMLRADTLMVLTSIARQMESMALRLGKGERPGHPDYISKAGAAEWAEGLAKDVRWVHNSLEAETPPPPTAAPELVEALKRICANACDDNGDAKPGMERILSLAREAIARGRVR